MDIKQIPLRNKQKDIIDYTLVSAVHFDELNKFKWNKTSYGYVQGTINKKKWFMHRYIKNIIMGIDLTRHNIIDHINNNRLDNTINNLRVVSSAENSRNRTKQKNTKSKYIGVTFDKKRWVVKMIVNETPLYASYVEEEHAAHQYNLWCNEYNLFTAKLNDISKESIKTFIPYKKDEKKQNFPQGIDFRRDRYRVRVAINNKTHYVGEYKTYEESIKALDKNKN
jgi:hypothetical protein